MAARFLASGSNNLITVEETRKYMELHRILGALLHPAAALEITSGLALLFGFLRQKYFNVTGGLVLADNFFILY
jgi:uncharacterized membrane protein YphA (DoxX/SURF4 family)